jgi:hypothetical protein
MLGLFAISTLAACTALSVTQKDTPLVMINSAFLRGDTFVIDYNVRFVMPGAEKPPSYWAEYRHGDQPVIHHEPLSALDVAGAVPVPIQDVTRAAGDEPNVEHLKSLLTGAEKAVRDTGPRIYRIAPPAGRYGADRYFLAYLGPADAGVQVIGLAPQGVQIRWGGVAAIAGILMGVIFGVAVYTGCA